MLIIRRHLYRGAMYIVEDSANVMRWLNRLLGRAEPVNDASRSVHPVSTPPPLAPFKLSPAPPAVPAQAPSLTRTDVCIAAVGDLHGRSDLLVQIMTELDQLARDPSRRLIEVYLGDYVDRGADSRGVLDSLTARKRLTDREVVCLAGNHEAMLISATRSDEAFAKWMEFGGATTLRSYSVSQPRSGREVPVARAALRAALPLEHMAFLEDLDLSYSKDGFFFAHAGIRPGIPLAQQAERDLLWIREPFLSSEAEFGAIVIHGHTPNSGPVLRKNRIGIDTGAYQTSVLTCAIVSSDGIRFLNTRP